MILHALANRVPSRCFTQSEAWEAVSGLPSFARLRPGSQELLRKILCGDSGIRRRHFCRNDLAELSALDGGELNAVFEKEAVALGTAALRDALEQARLPPGELDALLVCTCTGYLCPGLSSHLAERAGLRPDVQLVDSAGQGCGAALPLLRQAAALLKDGASVLACVAVEICSAAFYLDDDPGVLVSFCLFADGVSASVWGREGTDGIARASDFQSLHWPEHREELRFVNERGHLKNVLRPTVPEVAAKAVTFLHREHAQPDTDVLVHPGGKRVLEAIEQALGRPLPQSRLVLERYGNMSSPSILFVLEEWLANNKPTAWLASFGAGFTCHALRIQKR